MKKILQDLGLTELENLISSLGEKPFRAKQLYTGLMQGKKISQINIPSALRGKILEEYEDEPVKIIKTLTSSDGTEKYLFALSDGNVIEGVLMKYKYGNTQCVSTQVGCRMGCKFLRKHFARAYPQPHFGRNPFADFNGERTARRRRENPRRNQRGANGQRRAA